MDIKEIKKKLKDELGGKRYDHTMGVMYTAASLAMKYRCNMDDCLLAGLLHDCAKYVDDKEKIKICKKNNIEISEAELMNPSLLHAKVGAYLAKTKYDVTDENILHAIEVHTTGEPGMSLLDKIIFVADYIEPGRNQAPRLDEVRETAFNNLDDALEMILHDTLEYLKDKSAVLDPKTKSTYDYYRRKHDS
ncbi:MAG: bis(5'-nucleosyl)-tetraphosphatase (symmetrical) YqeK [Lachnospiraceae bacterium]|nr:bis(5'-nucleosyl)-tetraphosphatase (symmetrical) YqeK [Lachnospiraceae bacterium]